MATSPERPNVMVYFSDQQRWDTVGAYGQPLDVTPNLDRMAAEGTRFDRAFTCQPVCGPARAAIQTGKYPAEIGCFRNGIKLPPDERTIAHRLSDAGYEVGYGIFRREDRGKGYATEALRIFSSYLFELKPIPRLHIATHVDNAAAQRVAEKCGYKLEGTLRQFAFLRGKYADYVQYSLLRDECPSLAQALRA